MKIIDRVLAALETFIERQRYEVLDLVPELGRSRSNAWQADLLEQTYRLHSYIETYELVKRAANLDVMDRDLLLKLIEFADEADG